jgi:hypothetical protein
MELTDHLRKEGYDLIEGPVRNHKPLQLWIKQAFNEAELYYSNINQAFVSQIQLTEIESQALNINSTRKNDYGFNIGITILEEILKSLGLGAFELSAKVKSGKSVTISYDNAITKEVPIGDIDSYLSNADFSHPNPSLLKNANRDYILIITGIVFAKNLVVEIETDFNLDAALVVKLNEIADGKLDFTMNNQTKLKMISIGNSFFPVAVKASRIHFDKGLFTGMNLITDIGNWF